MTELGSSGIILQQRSRRQISLHPIHAVRRDETSSCRLVERCELDVTRVNRRSDRRRDWLRQRSLRVSTPLGF